jgi:hypothetical protein
MYILIPVDGENAEDSKITSLASMETWALVNFEEGKAKEIHFSDDRTTFDVDWIEYVILDNKFENSMDFVGEGMMCLIKRQEETLDELVSAFAFKELDEIGM